MVYVEKVLYRTLVDGGVTTMRDVGGATHAMKRLVDEGVIIGPRLKVAICMLSTTGGHADFRGPDRCHATVSRLWPPGPGRPSSIVDGPWECRKRVREIAACWRRSDQDSARVPGVASPDETGWSISEFSPEPRSRRSRTEASARGLRGRRSRPQQERHRDSPSDHGVHDIQHISYMDERLVERAFERGCTVTPTSWVIHALQTADGLSDFVREKARQVMEVHAKAVEHARSGGLKILMGTDPVLPGMHGRNWMELAHLVRDGLSALEAWYGSTGLAAEEIGQTDSGSIEAGQRADLCVWTSDVLAAPEAVDGALLEVVKDGEGHRAALPGLPQRTFASTVGELLNP